MVQTAADRQDLETTEADFAVSGMTCASCAARVQKSLERSDGVTAASVNLATERATVSFDADRTTPDELVEAVGRLGYGLAPLTDTTQADGVGSEAVLQRMWLRRVLVAWPLGVLVLVLSLWFMDDPWARWGAFVLTVPVQFWAGWPFLHQAAVRARARTANMDTLIAMGTLAAFAFSTCQVVFGGRHAEHYFDTSALIIAFLLLGRYFEARAKGRASSAIRSLLELGAKEARVLGDDGEERLVPVEPGSRRRTGCGCGPARRSPSTGRSSRARRRSTSRCSPASRSRSTRGRATGWRAPPSTLTAC